MDIQPPGEKVLVGGKGTNLNMANPDLKNTFDYSEDATNGTATKNSTTNIDLKITGDKIYLNGGQFLYKDAVWGDYISAQIVDKDNVLGYGTNAVLKTYITKRYIHPSETNTSIELAYVGAVPKDVYLRIKYTSVGTTLDVPVAVNYYLHTLL